MCLHLKWVTTNTFVNETDFSLLYILSILPKDQLTVYTCIYLWASVQFHWSIFLPLCQYHNVLLSIALWYVLKSGSVRPPAWFFFLNSFLAIWHLWKFDVNFRFCLFVCFCKNCHWVFYVDCIDFVTLFASYKYFNSILQILKCGMSYHLFLSSLIFLKICSFQCIILFCFIY